MALIALSVALPCPVNMPIRPVAAGIAAGITLVQSKPPPPPLSGKKDGGVPVGLTPAPTPPPKGSMPAPYPEALSTGAAAGAPPPNIPCMESITLLLYQRRLPVDIFLNALRQLATLRESQTGKHLAVLRLLLALIFVRRGARCYACGRGALRR